VIGSDIVIFRLAGLQLALVDTAVVEELDVFGFLLAEVDWGVLGVVLELELCFPYRGVVVFRVGY
jgi:hypothetical protein